MNTHKTQPRGGDKYVPIQTPIPKSDITDTDKLIEGMVRVKAGDGYVYRPCKASAEAEAERITALSQIRNGANMTQAEIKSRKRNAERLAEQRRLNAGIQKTGNIQPDRKAKYAADREVIVLAFVKAVNEHGPMCIKQVCEKLGKSRHTVSKIAGIIRARGLLDCEKVQNQHTFYSMNDAGRGYLGGEVS